MSTFLNKKDFIAKIILYSFVVLVPLSVCRCLFESYTVKYWVVQIGVSVVFLIYISGGVSVSINRLVSCSMAGYVLVNFISWIFIPYPFRNVSLPIFTSVLFYVILCLMISRYIDVPDKIIMLWIITSMLVALIGIYQYNAGDRVVSTLGNENFLASYIAPTILVVLGFFIRFIYHEKNIIKCYFFAGVGFILLFAYFTVLYFAQSRGAWFGLITGSICFLILSFVPEGKRLMVSILIIFMFIAVISTPLCSRFIAGQFEGDVRPAIWEGTMNMIGIKPFFGWGKGAYFIFYPQFKIPGYWLTNFPTNLTTHAHNEFLQIAAETGIIGLAAFLMIIISIFRVGIVKINNFSIAKNRFVIIGFMSGVICLLTHNIVCNNLQIHSSAILLWIMLGLILGIYQFSQNATTIAGNKYAVSDDAGIREL